MIGDVQAVAPAGMLADLTSCEPFTFCHRTVSPALMLPRFCGANSRSPETGSIWTVNVAAATGPERGGGGGGSMEGALEAAGSRERSVGLIGFSSKSRRTDGPVRIVRS